MEIGDIRQELNDLLENIVDHSGRYSEERPIPSLEVSFVLSKINKMQENLTILKYLLEQQEKVSKRVKNTVKKPVVEVEEQIDLTAEIEEKLVVVEEITSEIETSKAEITEQSSIAKLADSLTLNDRYLFANELFNKDMNVFNEFVKEIDNAINLSKAKELLFGLNLDVDNEHVASFSELIDRRFS